jgi:hypothetical protein
VESKQRKRKSKKSEILFRTIYKNSVKSKEKGKPIKMKGKAERDNRNGWKQQRGNKSQKA